MNFLINSLKFIKKKNMFQLIQEKDEPVAKRTRFNKPFLMKKDKNKNKYISATEFENFCKGDKIVDWFSILSKTYILEEEDKEHPLSFLFKKGVEYEDHVIQKLRELTGLELNKMSSLKTSREYDEKDKKYEETDRKNVLEAMERGDPIIYSGYISDKKEYIRGIPDLMVRNDYVLSVFKDLDKDLFELDNKENYYIPVEIKFSTVHLDASNSTVLNQDRMKFYKTQLYTYCKILESIQGVFPKCALIIGKKIKGKDGSLYNPIHKPGLIDFSSKKDDHISEIFYQGLEWLRSVKKDGVKWKLTPDIYPNMKIDHPIHQKDKKEIAESIGEITEIWQCGLKNRENAFKKGIYSWRDPKLDSKIMEISEKYKKTVDLLLKVNRGELGDFYCEKKENKQDIKENENNMYVDFETVRESLFIEDYGDNSNGNNKEWIFLIGVWYKSVYTAFLMSYISEEEEKRVMNEFYHFWTSNGKPKCWNWFAEKEIWNRGIKRNDLSLEIDWKDLYEIFKEENIVVKGCKNFKLKSYVKSLSSLGYIQVEFPDDCTNGLEAMFMAWKYYFENDKDKEKMKSILKYNEFDCIYLEKLLNFYKSI